MIAPRAYACTCQGSRLIVSEAPEPFPARRHRNLGSRFGGE
jgi:hypothetical protein